MIRQLKNLGVNCFPPPKLKLKRIKFSVSKQKSLFYFKEFFFFLCICFDFTIQFNSPFVIHSFIHSLAGWLVIPYLWEETSYFPFSCQHILHSLACWIFSIHLELVRTPWPSNPLFSFSLFNSLLFFFFPPHSNFIFIISSSINDCRVSIGKFVLSLVKWLSELHGFITIRRCLFGCC